MKAKSNQVNQWLPVALCCVPGVTVAAIVGVGAILGGAWVSGPIGTGLIALGVLMRRMSHNAQPGDATLGADCCAPAASNNLASLQAQREALEKEVAELETN